MHDASPFPRDHLGNEDPVELVPNADVELPDFLPILHGRRETGENHGGTAQVMDHDVENLWYRFTLGFIFCFIFSASDAVLMILFISL